VMNEPFVSGTVIAELDLLSISHTLRFFTNGREQQYYVRALPPSLHFAVYLLFLPRPAFKLLCLADTDFHAVRT
jgi:hypothetical protein